MKNSQKGFIVPILLVVSAVLVIGATVYIYKQNKKPEAPIVVVNKTGQNPHNNPPATVLKTQSAENKIPPVANQDETLNWKTYRDDTYGFEFKYPASFSFSLIPPLLGYVKGNNLLELIDNKRACYIGPQRAVGLEGSLMKEKSIATLYGNIALKYFSHEKSPDEIFTGGVASLDGLINSPAKLNGIYTAADVSFGITSTNSNLILYTKNIAGYVSKGASGASAIPKTCIEDFETILSTLKFTK